MYVAVACHLLLRVYTPFIVRCCWERPVGVHCGVRVSFCSAPDRSRLRLVSACALLKIAQCSNYKELISPDQFLRLALTMQVCQCYTVKVARGCRDDH